ncbi:unnamed protein product [Nesidiocoris tenuis]|uniref:Uncharacterized protein n=1 Tax=Nesidiocoris tenuis TaxID=355587 RepID=A0A6H5HDN0_9HEMI|nr:unnamed protein product [Nesidiocoris tenuis]
MSSGQFMYVRNLCGILSRPAIQFSSEDSFRSPTRVCEGGRVRGKPVSPEGDPSAVECDHPLPHLQSTLRILCLRLCRPHGTCPPALPTLCRPLSSPRSARSPSFSYRLF